MGFAYKKGTEISDRNVEEADEYYTDFSPKTLTSSLVLVVKNLQYSIRVRAIEPPISGHGIISAHQEYTISTTRVVHGKP
jgi:hypothetical protein